MLTFSVLTVVTTPADFERPKHASRNMLSSMKYDEGSTEYKNWLTRSTTLNDIYSNFIRPKPAETTSPSNDVSSGPKLFTSRRRQDKPVHEEYEEGDVTGYAMQQPDDVNVQTVSISSN